MSRAEYWVTPNGTQGWKIVYEGKDYTGYATQAHAIDAAREAGNKAWNENSQPAQVHVARPNGQWRTEWTYGNDPKRYPG